MNVSEIDNKDCRDFFEHMEKYGGPNLKNSSVEKMYQAFKQRLIEEQIFKETDDGFNRIVDTHRKLWKEETDDLGYFQYSPE